MRTLIGMYEKALPASLSWPERLGAARRAGYDFVEMSVDETDERLARLDMPQRERLDLLAAVAASGLRIPSMCRSAPRRFPFGSRDGAVPGRARETSAGAFGLAVGLRIRTVPLTCSDVLSEEPRAIPGQSCLNGLDR